MRRPLSLAATLVIALSAAPAPAQTRKVDVSVEVSDDLVEVGQPIQLSMRIATSQTVARPHPGRTQGFRVRGEPSLTRGRSVVFDGSRLFDTTEMHYVWTLEAVEEGTFVIGPPSAEVGGKKVTGVGKKVTVVAAGKLPPLAGTPFGRIPGFGTFGVPKPPRPEPDGYELAEEPKPELALPKSLGPHSFVYATVDKSDVVVGEQVTLSILTYACPVPVRMGNDKETNTPDFLRHMLFAASDNGTDKPLGVGMVGDEKCRVFLRRRWALFPLKVGTLEIGPHIAEIAVAGARGTAKRGSLPLEVRVVDTPREGRPVGYAPGDVGKFRLSAEVTPRSVDVGGAVSVTIRLEGTGNMPSTLRPPGLEGTEWLEPEVREDLKPMGETGWGGVRTFRYAVRINRPGEIRLGDMELPYFDVGQRKYQIARAALGVVEAKGAAMQAPEPPGQGGPFASLPGVRKAPSPRVSEAVYLGDSPQYWWGLGLLPTTMGLALLGRRAGSRWYAARQAKKGSPDAELRSRIDTLKALCRGDDASAIDGASAGVLAALADARTGIKVRGIAAADVAATLRSARVSADVAEEFASRWKEIEEIRFLPEPASLAAARGRAKEVLALVSHFGRP